MDDGWSGEAKYQALLAVAEAAHSQRELSRVLDAVAGALENLVRVDVIGVLTHEADGVRARAIYLRDRPRGAGESQEAYVRRVSEAGGAREHTWAHIPVMRDALENDRRTLILDHISSDTRLDGSGIKNLGAECAVLLPLTLGDAFVAGNDRRTHDGGWRSRRMRFPSCRTSPGLSRPRSRTRSPGKRS